MKAFFLALCKALEVLNTILEIKARRLVLDEYERCENEINKLEKQIEEHRNNGEYDAASLLLKRQARRARFSVRMVGTREGRDIHSSP